MWSSDCDEGELVVGVCICERGLKKPVIADLPVAGGWFDFGGMATKPTGRPARAEGRAEGEAEDET